jgi:hypothetical protein
MRSVSAGIRRAREAFGRQPAAFVAGLVVVVAAAVRLAHVAYGLPHLYIWEEETIVNPAREMLLAGRLWPLDFYRYPSLDVDLQALVSVPAYFRALASSPAYLPFRDLPIFNFYLYGRLIALAFGVAGVLLVYLFAARVWRRPWWGVAAAGLLAVASLNVFKSRMICPDAPMATLALAACYFLFRFRISAARRHLIWAGVFMGAAVGMKYNAASFTLAAFVVLALARARFNGWLSFIALTAGVFLLTTPGAIFRSQILLNQVGEVYYTYAVSGDGVWNSRAPLWDIAKFLFREGLTPVPALAILPGAFLVVKKFRWGGVAFLTFPVAFLAPIAGWAVWYPELTVNVAPFLALAAAAVLGVGCEWVAAQVRGGGGKVLVVVAAVVFFAVPAAFAVRDLYFYGGEDPRTQALMWVDANVPWPATIVKATTHQRPLALGGETDAPPLDDRKYDVIRVAKPTPGVVDEWARRGAQYFLGKKPKDKRSPDGVARPIEAVRVFTQRPGIMPNPVTVFRLDDGLLTAAHPYRESIAPSAWMAKREAPPYEPIAKAGFWLALVNDARVACYFTAPPGDYRLGFMVKGDAAGGVPPRFRVYVDGAVVGDFGVGRPGRYWTEVLPAGERRYHHLLLRYYNDAAPAADGGDRNAYLGGIWVQPVR